MAETLLFFTELLGMPVHDLKGRRIGRVKDAALVPLVHPVPRRPLPGGRRLGAGSPSGTTRSPPSPSRAASSSATSSSPPTTTTSTCCASAATCWTSRSSTSTAARWCASTMSPSRSGTSGGRDVLQRPGSGHRHPQHRAPPAAGRAAAARGSAGCRAPSRPIPSAGNSATSSSPIRSAACA